MISFSPSCEEYSTVLPSQTFGIIFNNEVMFWIRLVNVRGISNWVSEEILEWIRFAISRSVIGLVKSRYFLTNYMQINRYSFLGFMSSLHWPPLTHTFALIGYCSRQGFGWTTHRQCTRSSMIKIWSRTRDEITSLFVISDNSDKLTNDTFRVTKSEPRFRKLSNDYA